MLTEHQRRELAAIEHRLNTEDPELARMLSSGLPASRPVLAAHVLGSFPGTLMIFGTLMVLAGAGLGVVAVVRLIVLVVAAAFMAPGPLRTWAAPGPPR
jgi:hypothetical protein